MASRNKRRLASEINVVPYIDVMLVLLVIFMVTAPLLTQGVSVNLPQAAAKPLTVDNDVPQLPLVVSVDAEGQFYISVGSDPKAAVTPKTLMARAAAVLRVKPNTPVMVKGDKNVQYAHVVTAMVMLQKAGAPKVGLITDPPATADTSTEADS